MRKYNEYEDSGVEWLGKIPKEWNKNRLAFLGEFSKGGGISKADLTEEGEAVVLYGDIYTKYEIQTTVLYRRTSKEIAAKSKEIEFGDILFTGSGETAEDIGKCIVYLGQDRAYAGGDVLIFRPFGVSSLFLSYVLNCNEIKAEKAKLAKGQIIIHIYASQLRNLTVPIPPLSEQYQIAKYLDHKTSQIDKLITDKEKLIELLNEERTAMINQAVTKGLNPNVPMKDSGMDWLGEVPEHWEVKKLKYVAKVVLGKMLTSENKGGYFLRPYLRAKNIGWLNVINVDDIKDMWFSQSELNQYRIKRNDLLVSEGGEVGRTCIWKEEIEECYIQNSVHKVTVFQEQNPLFILYLFNLFGFKGHFDAIVNKISIAHLTKEKLSDIEIIVPPRVEQDELVSFLICELKRIEELNSKINHEIKLLKEYKTALISELVTGKVDVRDEVIPETPELVY